MSETEKRALNCDTIQKTDEKYSGCVTIIDLVYNLAMTLKRNGYKRREQFDAV